MKKHLKWDDFCNMDDKDSFKMINELAGERDALRAELARATRALERAGFTDHGAEEWKPPIGWGDTGTQRERLIALEDELARVKAESLRVVVDGDAVLLRYVIAPFAMTESRTIIKKNFGEWVSLDGAATNPSLLDTIAKPARLKPWEEE